MARITLQTIADEVGVSRMTVSNAYSRPDQLSPTLRSRILEAAERLGYAGPSPSARALVRGRTGVIGMVLTDSPSDAFSDEVAIAFVRGVANTLADDGYSLVLLNSSPRSDFSPTRDVAMDGAVIYSCWARSDDFTVLQERRLPLVAVESTSAEGVPRVLIDDAAGSAEAAAHLVELGHTDVALVVTSVDADGVALTDEHRVEASLTIGGRIDGWVAPLVVAGITPRVVGTADVGLDDTLKRRIGRLLDDPPTAVLAFSDLAALEVIEQAQARGIRVPEDLSVVGFDDSPLAARVTPALTTINQDSDAKGQAAARTLLALLRDESPDDIVLGTRLVVRQSTGPAPR